MRVVILGCGFNGFGLVSSDLETHYYRDLQEVFSVETSPKTEVEVRASKSMLLIGVSCESASESGTIEKEKRIHLRGIIRKQRDVKDMTFKNADVARRNLAVLTGEDGEEAATAVAKRRKLLTPEVLQNSFVHEALSGAADPLLTIPVRVVACGKEHFLLLTRDTGIVFAWGGASRGQLGLGPPLCQLLEPRRIECFDGLSINRIACGGWHSLATTAAGDLYSWGWNESGQLGLGTEVNIEASPSLVSFCGNPDEEPEVLEICAGSRHSVALVLTKASEEHTGEIVQGRPQLYSWGWDRYGQLGSPAGEECNSPNSVASFDDGVTFQHDSELRQAFCRSETIMTPRLVALSSFSDSQWKIRSVTAAGWNTFVELVDVPNEC